ncbi:MAG: right-handed parallel beta-helix repeat-containing protein, partial [Clostridia bacterium]|nr:right-handed parallel beta-helix repeat-containing protein [Clostridia bacterium]
MRRKIIALVLVLSVFLSLYNFSVFAKEADIVFADDFENGITKWTKTENSAFSVRKFDTKQLVFISTPEKNKDNLISTYNTSGKYKVEFDLIAPKGEYAGFYFNYNDEKTYYLLKINLKAAYAEVVKKVNGGEEVSVKGENFACDENVTKVTVEYNDGIRIYFNEQLCINSAEKSINDGKIGFGGVNSAFRIDNVSLEKYKEEQVIDTKKKVISNIGMPSTKETIIDGTTTKSQFESRVADLPTEIPLADLTEVKGEIELFISPNGSDSNSGTKDKPFKTIERAVQEVGYLNTLKPQPEGIIVYLREGQYIVDKTINIDKTFSGTEEHPVFISSYNGEKVSLVSGMFFSTADFEKVTDTKKLAKLPESSRDKVYVTSLSGVSSTELGDPRKNRLYANGNLMECARWPNFTEMSLGTVIRGGNSTSLGAVMLDIEPGVEWEPLDARPFTWEDTGRIYFDGAFVAAWDRHTAFVTFDKEQRRISTPSQSYVNPAVSHPQVLHHFRNIFEEIDMPGEWYLDEKEKKLYLYPFSENEEYEYYFSCKSNDIFNFRNVENVVVNGISIEGSGAKGYVFDGCKNCIIQAGEIKNTKDRGAHFMLCEGCGVLDNYIYNVGYADTNGIHFDGIIWGQNGEDNARVLKESIGKELKPKNNFVQNNLVSCPEGTHRALAVNAEAGTVMSHNTVSNTYRYAFYQSNSPEAIVEYNETAVCPKDIWDAGVIYSIGGLMPMGHHVRNNFFHHMNKGATGIYFDDLSSDTMAYNNILLDINECGISIHGGRDVTARNNIVISTNDAGWVFGGIETSNDYYADGYPNESLYTSTYMRVAKELDAAGDVYYQKIQERFPRYFERFKQVLTVAKNREMLGDKYVRDEAEDLSREPSHNYFESNIVVGQSKNYNFKSSSLPTIEDHGNFESKSRYEVGFRDIDNYDFYIPEDSEIYKTIPSFKNIDISTVGIVKKDGRWENLPKIEVPVAIYPIDGGKGMEHHEKVTLKWLPQILANKYTVTVATDPEFKNIVLTQKTMGTMLDISLPSQGTTYYWKLDAECLLKSVTSDPATSKIYSFTTMNDDEIKVAFKPNLSY